MNIQELSDKELKSLKENIFLEEKSRKQKLIDADRGFEFKKNEHIDAYGERYGKYGVTFTKNGVSMGFVYENQIFLSEGRMSCDDIIFVINKCKSMLEED